MKTGLSEEGCENIRNNSTKYVLLDECGGHCTKFDHILNHTNFLVP